MQRASTRPAKRKTASDAVEEAAPQSAHKRSHAEPSGRTSTRNGSVTVEEILDEDTPAPAPASAPTPEEDVDKPNPWIGMSQNQLDKVRGEQPGINA